MINLGLENKKIGILGLGAENLSLVKYLLEHNYQNITILDAKVVPELQEKLPEVDITKIKTFFGEDYLSHLKGFDVIFRTPGISYLTNEIQAAKNQGTEISSQTKLFFKLCPCPIIGVTGTKGKGTTSTLIYNILKRAGRDVYLGGNIGNAPIEFLDQLTPQSLVVLELSSFQLHDLDQSPHIAVILNITSDHLDVHKDNAEYVSAKANIVKHQNATDFACINEDYLTSFEFASLTKGQVFWFSRKKSVDQGVWIKNKEQVIWQKNEVIETIIETKDIFIKGEHNWENIAAASLVAKLCEINTSLIAESIRDFKGLEHRLELIRELDGVKYYNDSFSTNPDTAIAAIKSFDDPIILIAGGSEKNADYDELGQAISQSTVKVLIVIGQTGSRIKEATQKYKSDLKIIDNCLDLSEVMAVATKESNSGDIVLLSPASASFDWFENYKDRGRKFKEKVLNL